MCQRFFVFTRPEIRIHRSLGKFLLIQLTVFAINTPFLALLVTGLGIDVRIAPILVLAVNAVWSYFAYHHFVFRR
jgi:hypothetical protein